MNTSNDGKVLRLRQYGKGGYAGTHGRIHKAIMAGKEFVTGAMRGVTVAHDQRSILTLGRLDREHHSSVKRADYVVYSYSTPIGWHIPASDSDGGTAYWVVPDDTYSVTTNRHQGLVRVALSLATVHATDPE